MLINKREGTITLIIVISVITFLYVYSYIRKKHIEQDPVYVIGFIYSIDPDLDGISYKFRYKFNGGLYKGVINSMDIHKQKSLILLKISAKDPSLWLHIEEDIPACITENPNFEKYWKSFPNCKN